MLNITSSVLGSSVPNILPRSVRWPQWHDGSVRFGHSHWMQPAGRLIWATLLFVIGLAIAVAWLKQVKRPAAPTAAVLGGLALLWIAVALVFGILIKDNGPIVLIATLLILVLAVVFLALKYRPVKTEEPSTWAATIAGAFFVWVMMTLAYAVIPHEWIIFANSYLRWGKDKFFLQQDQWATNLPPFSIQRFVMNDAIAAGFYVVFGVINIRLFAMWQKRPVETTETEAVGEGAGEAEPDPLTGPFSRLRRRASRTSAYGRPVTTGD